MTKERKFDLIFIISAIIFTLPLIFLFLRNEKLSYFTQDFVDGIVLEIHMSDLMEDPYVPGRKLGRQNITVELLEGEYKNQQFTITNNLTKGHNVLTEVGQKYIFTVRQKDDGPLVWLYNYNRAKYIYWLLGLFVVSIILIAGFKGIKSLISLYFTGVMIICVLIPLIFQGYDPVLYSILILSLTIIVSFFIISGYSQKTLGAIIGTIGGMILAGCISYVTARIANLSGINLEKGEQILYMAEDFNIRVKGILFISILIASSGAIMDIAMSIASSLHELSNNNPRLSAGELFRSGMNIGHDMIGTMVNTLILAFTGGSFALLLMISGLHMEYKQFINIPLISIEIIQAVSGSMGILLAVPLTNAATIFFIKRKVK